LAEELAGFGGGDAGIGGEAIEMVETGAGRPRGKRGFAELGEALLEAVDRVAGEGIARGNGAAGAGIAALEMNFADLEADGAALVFAEELIFPEGGHAIDFERGAEAEADIVEGKTGEPFGDGLERGGGDDGRAVGDGVIGEAAWGVADEDLLLEENTEPFGCVIVAIRKWKSAGGNDAAVTRHRERNVTQIGSENRPYPVNCGGALAVDPAAIHGIEGPGAVEREAAGRTDARFAN